MKNNLRDCQRLLLTWISIRGETSYEIIKQRCEYLNIQFELGIEEHPTWKIFFPLFKQGLVDLSSEGKYRAVPPQVIEKDGVYLFVNYFNNTSEEGQFLGVFKRKLKPKDCITYKFNAKAVLSHFPSFSQVVKTFQQLPIVDLNRFKFAHKSNLGLAQSKDNELGYYFVDENRMVFQIPDWKSNPDAINISYSLSKIKAGESIATYNKQSKILSVSSFRFPILLYRVLFIESLLNGKGPDENKFDTIFNDIPSGVVKELNRILEKSVIYE